jgi:hypothetical protein
VLFMGVAASVAALPVLAAGADKRRLARSAGLVARTAANGLDSLAPLL